MSKRRILLWLTAALLLVALLPAAVSATVQDGWVTNPDGTYSYYIDGEQLRDGVYMIEDEYYGFDYNGIMFKDTMFDQSVYNEAQGYHESFRYRAKDDGTLYVNEWYEDGGESYYYGEGGRMYEDGVYRIGDFYYGFNWEGWMYRDESFGVDVYDYEKEEWVYTYYRAKADGTLYVNEWHVTDWEKYYYGEEGKAPRDFFVVDGTEYFFDYGFMVTERMVYSSVREANYYISEDGTTNYKAPDQGWFEAEGKTFYIHEGEPCKDGIFEIDGEYYGFSWNGWLYKKQTFGISSYNEEKEDWEYFQYRAKADGTLCVNEWYEDEYGNWYYYGEGGKAPNDFLKLGNTWYFFNNGHMVKGQMVYSEAYGANYYIGEDGTTSQKIASDGWVLLDGSYYYVKDNDFYKGGVYQIGGKYYGFDWDGMMFDDTNFSMSIDDENNEYVGYFYFRAKKGGALYVNEWCHDGYHWYYYGEKGRAPNDFVKLGGTWYFFYDGRMAESEIVYSESYEAYYYINAGGKTSQKLPTTGWALLDGKYYYLKDGEYYRGVYQIGGKYYGFDYEGVMYDNTDFQRSIYDEETGGYIGHFSFRAKKGGALYVNEWYQEGDNWYYYGEQGRGAEGLQQINGKWYYFGFGRMYTNLIVSDGDAYYAVDKNGLQIRTPGKHAVEGEYVWVNEDGTLHHGWKEISGKKYYFGPQMTVNTIIEIEEKAYIVDGNGVFTQITTDGVYTVDGYYQVYIEDGKAYEGWRKIGGYWYYFAPYMVKGGVYNADGTPYVFDVSGKMFTGGWLRVGGYYYGESYYVYADASGKAAIGLKTIGSKKYYFNDEGYMLTDEILHLEDKTYVIDSNGVVVEVSTSGWNKIDGKWYYLEDGEFVYGEARRIGGKLYAFDYSGAMRANDFYSGWDSETDNYFRALLGADGAALTGWQKYGNQWVYGDEDGYLVNDKQTIGGKTYYFTEHIMRLGTFEWNEQIITTDAGGAVISEKNMADGWSYADGIVYYYKNGMHYTGWVGDYYVEHGVMMLDRTIEVEGKQYALDIYGRYVKSGWYDTSWSENYSYYVYAKAGGVLCENEWLKLGNTWYYFDNIYMVSDMTLEVDGKMCAFAENGKYLGVVTESSISGEGWKQVGSDWYYIYAGEPVTGLQTINGKRYVFAYDGVMLKNCFAGDEGEYYYLESSGAVASYTGWKKIDNQWAFFDNANRAVMGWLQDQGKVYYMTPYYDRNWNLSMRMVTGYMSDEAGHLHYFNASGVWQGEQGVQNGWYTAGGETYYFENGRFVRDYKVINGKGYYFSYEGPMLKNEVLYVGELDCFAYFDGNGVQRTTKGWYTTGEGRIYVGEQGRLYSGVWKIGGKEHYFRNAILVR